MIEVLLREGFLMSFKNGRQYDRALELVSEELRHELVSQGYKKKFTTVLHSYEASELRRTIKIPRGCGYLVKTIIKDLGDEFRFKDDTCKGHEISFKHKFEPRDDLQVEAIDRYVSSRNKNLILQGSCGFGKTYCALKILEKLSVSTLILVDENLLLDQWIENIEENCIFDLDKLGIVGKGKEIYEDKDVIVASKDTLINRPEIIKYINEHIGLVIVDEAHVASADIFQSVLTELRPSMVLGLTATPVRSDGLSFLMHEQLGPICFKAERSRLLELGSIMNPELRPIYVNRDKYFEKMFDNFKKKKREDLESIKPDENNKYKIGNRLYTEKTWMKKIKDVDSLEMDWTFLSNTVENDMSTIREISKIIKYHYNIGDQSICICRKIEFAKKYIETLKFMGVKESEIALILGETKSKERMELIEKAKNKELKIIITSSILDKGISIDSANVLFLLYPSKNENSTEQRIGRVSRTQAGKDKAYVYDFIYDHGMFFSQFFKSQKNGYKECRFNVEKYCTQYDKDELIPFMKKLMDYFYFNSDNFTRDEIINTHSITEKELTKNLLVIK